MPETNASGNAPAPDKGEIHPEKLKKLDTSDKPTDELGRAAREEKKS